MLHGMSDRPNDPPVRPGEDPARDRPRWSDLSAEQRAAEAQEAAGGGALPAPATADAPPPPEAPTTAAPPDFATEGPATPPAAEPAPPARDPALVAQERRDYTRIGLTLFLAALQPASAGLSTVFGLGRPIAEMSAASQTAVTPAAYAFAIWAPIFALSIAYAVWQALPARRDSPLCRRIGWPLIGAFALSNLWMILAQTTENGWHLVLVLAGVAAFALAAFLGARRAARDDGLVSRLLVAPLLGLFAGWTLPALFVNLAGAARATGAAWWTAEPTAAAMLTVIAAGAAGAALLRLSGRDVWFAGALLWALLAILAGNLGAVSLNLPVAIAAGGMAALVAWVARPER
jgi:hypothetical protein